MQTTLAPVDTPRDSVWRTDLVDGLDGIEAWISLLCEQYNELEVQSQAPDRFTASWERLDLGSLDLDFLLSSPQRVVRTRKMIARQKTADYHLLYLRQGPCGLMHCGTDSIVPEKSFVLLDNREPYQLILPDDSVCLSVHLQDRWLRRWVPHPRSITACAIDRTSWGAPLASLLETIADRGLAEAVLSRRDLADQIGALIALMAGRGEAPASLHQADMLARIKRELRDRYDDLELAPAAVAQSLGISKRHLHGLLAQSGATFCGMLVDIRLTRSAEMLKDARYAGYRVGDVAWACGFSDPSHFARRFRHRYGKSPQEYRSS